MNFHHNQPTHAYTEDHLVVQSSIDWPVLESRGWTLFALSHPLESDFREELLGIAAQLGELAATRAGGDFCDMLIPTVATAARPRSLSKIHSTGEFPLHSDTAHWPTPCRYVILACISPGSGRRGTLLLDTRRLPFSNAQLSLLNCTPLRVRNGRDSFFSTILSKMRPFVRFDPGCMTAITPDGQCALAVLSSNNWLDCVERINWETGVVLIIDNWRVLHGRDGAHSPDPDRKLLRISIRGKKP